jgi:hypothetical protein
MTLAKLETVNTAKPKFRRVPRTVVEAVSLLKRRYQEQCLLFPRTREIPEAMYVSRNLRDTVLGPWVKIED